MDGRSATDLVSLDLDSDGIAIEAPVADWLDLATAPETRQLQAVLRYSRPDGSIVFGPTGRSADRLRQLDRLASTLGDPSLAGVVARWLPSSQSSALPSSPPPLPSDSRPDRPLAIFRADWSPRGEILAIDHRQAGTRSLLEVAAKGQVWLGPEWNSTSKPGKPTRAVPSSSTTSPFAQSLEWSFAIGSRRYTRVATLLRGRSMILLGQQVEGAGVVSEVRLALASGVEASFVPGSRAIQLKAGPGKPTARLLPLGLPCHDRPTDRGSIAIEGREVVIRQSVEGRRDWLPVLICWDRPPTSWRSQTVAFQSKAMKLDQAVAARVSWGLRSPGLVVYRSLEAAALRSFLGHQTAARFLIGTFSQSGDVAPILKVDA